MLRFAIVLSMLLLGVVSSAPASETAGVLKLDAHSFHTSIASRRFVAVAFIAPWCAHCKRLEPEWVEAAERLDKHSTDVTLGWLDTTAGEENAALAGTHGVKGFPDVRIFRDGDTAAGAGEEYQGPRNADGIVQTLTRLAGDAATVLKTKDDVRNFVKKSPVVVLGVFDDATGDAETATNAESDARRRAFDKAARQFQFDPDSEEGDTIPFGVVYDASFVPELFGKLKKYRTKVGDVFCYRDFAENERVVRLRGFDEKSERENNPMCKQSELTTETVTEFVTRASLPVVAILDRKPESRQSLRRVFANDGPKVLMFADNSGIRKMMSEVARKFKESDVEELHKENAADATSTQSTLESLRTILQSTNFVLGRVKENTNALKFFDVKPGRTPAVVIHDTKTDSKWVLHDVTTFEMFFDWLSSFVRGELKPTIRSASGDDTSDEAETEPEKTVAKILVAKGFRNSLVGASALDLTLIMFHAPWCGHCKTFKPVYDAVASVFKDDKNINVVTFDAATNDVPDKRFDVTGFPAVRLFKKNGDSIVQYDGKRTEEELVAFVKKHVSGVSGGGDGEL